MEALIVLIIFLIVLYILYKYCAAGNESRQIYHGSSLNSPLYYNTNSLDYRRQNIVYEMPRLKSIKIQYQAYPGITNTQEITILEIRNVKQCEYACRLLLRDCQTYISALGFDCEWVQWGHHRNDVALLQLCSPSGTCCLFRLNLLKHIPQSLAEILSDMSILKVGVSSYRDGQYLFEDYSVQVNSTLDLRYCYNTTDGLARLASKHLGMKLDKDGLLPLSNWDVEDLSDDKMEYAAKDAYAGIELFKKWANMKGLSRSDILFINELVFNNLDREFHVKHINSALSG